MSISTPSVPAAASIASRPVQHSTSTSTSIPAAPPTATVPASQSGQEKVKILWCCLAIISLIAGVIAFVFTQLFENLVQKYGSPRSFFVTMIVASLTATIIIFGDMFCGKFPRLGSLLNRFQPIIRAGVLVALAFVTKMADDVSQDVTADKLGVVSNIFFALASLFCYKKFQVGFEFGVSSYFFGCCAMQILKFNAGYYGIFGGITLCAVLIYVRDFV